MSHCSSSPGPAVDVLLREAFHGYRQGLLRQPQPRSPMPPRDFDALRFLGTLGWVPLEERLRLRNLHLACGEGLAAARQGHFDQALVHYEQAREHLGPLENGTKLAGLLGLSTYQAGVAYLDFKLGRTELAHLRLDRAMDADLELERAGLLVMQLHRIQQGHNLVRMSLRLGQRAAAIGLTGRLVAYLERRIDGLPYHREWRSRSLQAVPRALLQAMIHQIIGEMAGFIAAGNAAGEWGGLIEASRLCRNPEAAVFPQVQHALKAQQSLLAEDPKEYLLNLARFFRPGIRDCPLLWYAIVVELAGFCLDADTRCSHQVRDLILRDSAKWKGFPPFLRDRLNAPSPAQLTVA